MSLHKLINWPIWPPMQSRTEWFRPSPKFFWIPNISSTFHDIYFPTCWPCSIFIIPGKKPYCRPEPISFGQLGPNFHSSVCKAKRINCHNLSTRDWINIMVSIRGSWAAIKCIRGTLVGISSPDIIGGASSHPSRPYFVVSEDWF